MKSPKLMKMVLIIWLASSLLGLTRFFEKVHPRYDSGAYIIAAKALAQGKGLVHLAHPENPPFTTYPPVIPVMLAPFAAFAQDGFVGLKIGMVLIFSLTLLAFAFAFRRFFQDDSILFALALLGSGSLLAFAGRIQGEAPFTLFGIASFYYGDKFLRQGYKWRDIVLCLVFTFLLCFSRQAGIAWAAGLVLAFAIYPRDPDHTKGEVLRRAAAGVLVVLLVALPWALLIHAIQPGSLAPDSASVLRSDGWDPQKGQIGIFSLAMLGRIKMNFFHSAVYAPESMFFTYNLSRFALTKLLFYPLFLLILIGYLYRLIRKRSAMETITMAYCGLIFVTPWLKEPRFFTVILPFLLVYLYEGTSYLSRKLGERATPIVFGAICLTLFFANLMGIALNNQLNPWSAKDNPDYLLAKFAAPHLPEDAVVLAHDHCAFYLLTGRKSLSFTASEQKFLPQYKLNAYLARGGRVDYIAWENADRELVDRFLREKGWTVGKVASEKGFFLHRVIESNKIQ